MKRLLPLLLACALLLTGCSAMLERSYTAETVHNRAPEAEGDSSILRAEDYQDLVSAVYYFVSQGAASGTVRLYNYDPEAVEADLDAACLEVVQEDPLGAYAVDYIKYDCAHIVSYYEADLSITYRRTAEQIASVVSVTGSSAIRAELQEALAAFLPELALRISYFSEGTDIQALLEQAYYATPAAAFGLPEAEISVYPPEGGATRVVEIVLSYPVDTEQAAAMSRKLIQYAQELADASPLLPGADYASAVAGLLQNQVTFDPEGPGTPYAALMEGSASSEGIALAALLLCRAGGVECQVVRGTLDGQIRFWNQLRVDGKTRFLDAAAGTALRTAQEMEVLGYVLPGPEEAGGAQP